jgi:replicative DNA helicase
MSEDHNNSAAVAKQGANYSERQLLGALLLDPVKIGEVSEVVRPEHFSTERGKYVYELLLSLSAAGQMFDLAVIVSTMKQQKKLDFVGGMKSLVELSQSVTTSQYAVFHAGVVRAAGTKRQIGEALSVNAKKLADLELKPDVVGGFLADLQGQLIQLDSYTARGEVAQSWMDAPTVAHEMCMPADNASRGLLTGWHDLDTMITGLTPGQLIVVGARPRMGKTALACSLLARFGPDNPDKTCLMFSLEMTSREIMQRLICARARVSMHDIRSRGILHGEDTAIESAAADLKNSSIVIRDTPGITMSQINQYSRQVQYRFGLSMIVVDYAQLVRSSNPKASRFDVVSETSRGLKELAKKLQVPVIALAQLNRNAEEGERPGMQDLRESGSLEQDADAVWLLHRPEVYKPKPDNHGAAELIVAKQRNGPTGTIDLTYLHGSMAFTNQTPGQSEPIH